MKRQEKAILSESRERWKPYFRFVEFEYDVSKWYMTFGRGMPHLRKYAIRVPALFAKFYMRIRPRRSF